MEKIIKLKSEFDSLNKVFDQVKNNSPYEATIEYDIWDARTDASGQMDKCILIKKSGMHGIKMHLESNQNLYASYVIPNKVLNAYFGKSQKRYRNIIEILAEKLVSAALAGSQKKAFEEMTQSLNKLAN